MSANDERVRGLIAQEAAEWFVANRAGLRQQSATALLHGSRPPRCMWRNTSHSQSWRAICARPVKILKALSMNFSLAHDLRKSAAVQPLWPRLVAGVTGVTSHSWQTAAVTMAAVGCWAFGLFALWNFRPVAPIGGAPRRDCGCTLRLAMANS